MLFCRTSALLLLDIFEQTVTNPLRTFGTMPYHDEEYPGQPLWQSVLLFCCKGMIEWIMVILFFWLLVQVLFTKQLEGRFLWIRFRYEGVRKKSGVSAVRKKM